MKDDKTNETLHALRFHNLSALCKAAGVKPSRVKNYLSGRVSALTLEERVMLRATAREAMAL